MSDPIDPRKAHQELQTHEALSRRDEAVAQIHASRGIKSEFTERAGQAEREAKQRDALAAAASAKDYEGTRTGVADAAGNVARNAAQANEGGIGVAASNSGASEQSARVQTLPVEESAAKGQAPAPSSDKSDDEVSKIDIPDNWSTFDWPKRAALARSVARGKEVKNGDDAEAAIKAELERRGK